MTCYAAFWIMLHCGKTAALQTVAASRARLVGRGRSGAAAGARVAAGRTHAQHVEWSQRRIERIG